MYLTYNRDQKLERAHRLKDARIARGYPTAAAAADAFKWSRNTYASNENGNAPYSFGKAKSYAEAFGVRAEWLYDGAGPNAEPAPRKTSAEPLVPIIGVVGDTVEDVASISADGFDGGLAPRPPGGSAKTVALRVVGRPLRNIADDGGLIYFEDHRRGPTPDMIGVVVVVETDADLVLVKQLHRGSRAGRYDLEGADGAMMWNQRLRWASHIIAIIPPHHARRIIRTAGA